MPRKKQKTTTSGPKGYVVQKGRLITVTGLTRAWKPAAADLANFDPNMRLTRSEALGPGAEGRALLSFTSTQKAEEAFGKLFGDMALGLADALPDDTQWVDGNMRATARALSRGT